MKYLFGNLLLLIPVVIGLVMLVRWLQGRAVFTEGDWFLLFGEGLHTAAMLRFADVAFGRGGSGFVRNGLS